ncbi:TonB-dependent hemoglobin/transferrin/lactoferrin family receptor [Alysiella filiformis DSM 16848]|nr:TonB-dependent hemoglobin/transferrin/lactoferrin family receptor [Alysiella filiformis]UBQ57023.1 TonB-dependent hemoglobin/transferrin/lactoferrin family receptor [Alysiella filiformis DSM 16848]
MMKTPFKLGAISLLVLHAFPVYADDSPPNNNQELETVKVRGKRTPARLGENKTKREKLDQNLVQDIRDMVRYDPSVSVVEGGRGASNGFAIRGVDKDRVAINIDGLAQAESRSSEAFQELFGGYGNFNANRNANELENIAEVAVKKGADSIGSGSGALGGAVEFKTKSPTDVVSEDQPFAASAKTGYTSKNRETMTSMDVAGRIKNLDARLVYTHRHGHETKNHPVSQDTHNVIAQGEQIGDRKRGESVYNLGAYGKLRSSPDPQHYRSKSTLFKLGYHLNENNYLLGTFDEYRQDRTTHELSNLWGSRSYSGTEPSNEQRRRQDVTYTKRRGIAYENRAETGLWDKLNVGYDKQNIQMSTMTWDIPVNIAQTGVNSEVLYMFRRITQDTAQWYAKADKDLNFNKIQWNMSYGIGGSKATNQNDNFSVSVKAFAPTMLTSNRGDSEFLIEAQSKKHHAFINNVFRVGDFRIGVGGRYDWIKMSTLPNDKFIKAMTQKGLNDATAKFKSGNTALSLDWQFAPNWAVQSKVSTAFRAPTTDEMWLAFPHPEFNLKANPALKAEQARNFELGWAGGGKWGNVQVSGFQTRYKDFIDLAYLGNETLEYFDGKTGTFQPEVSGQKAPTYQNVNQDKATIKGVELNGRLNLGHFGLPQGTFGTLTASYQKGNMTKGNGEKAAMNALQPFGAVLGLGYEHPEQKWGLTTNISYTKAKKPSDTIHSNEDVRNPWPYARHGKNYTLVDVLGHYNVGKHLTVRAGVFNVLNKRHFTWDSLRSIREFGTVNRVDNCNNSNGAPQHATCAHNGIQRFTAPARHFALSLQAKF